MTSETLCPHREEIGPDVQVSAITMDLAVLSSVREASKAVLAQARLRVQGFGTWSICLVRPKPNLCVGPCYVQTVTAIWTTPFRVHLQLYNLKYNLNAAFPEPSRISLAAIVSAGLFEFPLCLCKASSGVMQIVVC